MLLNFLRSLCIQNIELKKLKTKNQRYKTTKNENTARRKPSFTKRIGRKCRLI